MPDWFQPSTGGGAWYQGPDPFNLGGGGRDCVLCEMLGNPMVLLALGALALAAVAVVM